MFGFSLCCQLNNLIQIKQQIYTKLDKLAIQPTNQVENEMNLLIDSLRVYCCFL